MKHPHTFAFTVATIVTVGYIAAGAGVLMALSNLVKHDKGR